MKRFTPAPKKPPQIVLDLAGLGRIYKIEAIDAYDMTHDLTRVVLCGKQPSVMGDGDEATLEYRWRDIEPYVEQNIAHGVVLRLQRRYQKAVTDWNKLMKENAAEYAEYERLKAKFDRDR